MRKTINIHDAKAQLSRVIARIERGLRTVIARIGKPVAERRDTRNVKKLARPLHDPLLRVDEYSCDSPIGPTANDDIDSTVYGIETSLWRHVLTFRIRRQKGLP